MLLIREAVPGDAEAIAAIHADSWSEAYKDIVPPAQLALRGSREYRLDSWKKKLAEPDGRHFVALEPFGPVGYFTLAAPKEAGVPPDTWELHAIYFAPQHWRRGYGTQCMSLIFNHLREQGFRYLSLWVFQENQRAAAFYRKLGFSPDGAERPVAPDSDILEVRFLREL